METLSEKYPRSPHLPWSPGGAFDDKRLLDVSSLLGKELVITEKCDGSNLTYTRNSIFARSHNGPPPHVSFDLAKATHAQIKRLIPEGLSVFCEYCYAVHAIEYRELPDYSLVFGVRDDATGEFWSWDRVSALAEALDLPTVPEVYRGVISSGTALREVTEGLAYKASSFGGIREGVVVRLAQGFHSDVFDKSLAKWVRSGHIQTNEHWTRSAVRPQRLSFRRQRPTVGQDF